ncbi:MAG: hypothetical protein MRJ52_06915, partial [Nitrosomonas sp.]|nr:hypothetical protein [Nitrosomonas sp.]
LSTSCGLAKKHNHPATASFCNAVRNNNSRCRQKRWITDCYHYELCIASVFGPDHVWSLSSDHLSEQKTSPNNRWVTATVKLYKFAVADRSIDQLKLMNARMQSAFQPSKQHTASIVIISQ